MFLVEEAEEELLGILQTKNPQESENYDDDRYEDGKSQYHTKHDSLRRVSAPACDVLSCATSDERLQSEIIEDDFLLRQCGILTENEYSRRNIGFENKSGYDSDIETSTPIQNAEDNGNMYYHNEYMYDSDGAIIHNLVTDIEHDEDDVHLSDMQSLDKRGHQRFTVRYRSIEKNDEVSMDSLFQKIPSISHILLISLASPKLAEFYPIE